MEGSRFDALTTSLAARTGRRTAMQVLAGSALGAIGLARFGAAPAAARCKRPREECKADNACCSACCWRNQCRRRRRCQAEEALAEAARLLRGIP
jgi:hypothetical protein